MGIEKKLVEDWMTYNPITITPDTTLPVAHQLMKDNNVRRLPVLDGKSILGIVTLGDVRAAGPSESNSLSIYELRFLLSSTTVDTVMTTKLYCVKPEDTLDHAAQVMLGHKVGGLPVIDDDGLLAGIISESDIFKAVMEIFDQNQ